METYRIRKRLVFMWFQKKAIMLLQKIIHHILLCNQSQVVTFSADFLIVFKCLMKPRTIIHLCIFFNPPADSAFPIYQTLFQELLSEENVATGHGSYAKNNKQNPRTT